VRPIVRGGAAPRQRKARRAAAASLAVAGRRPVFDETDADTRDQLHRSGWSAGKTALVTEAGGPVRVVDDRHEENGIWADGASQAEAWRALDQARAEDVAAEQRLRLGQFGVLPLEFAVVRGGRAAGRELPEACASRLLWRGRKASKTRGRGSGARPNPGRIAPRFSRFAP
jgi:hypothetical protein